MQQFKRAQVIMLPTERIKLIRVIQPNQTITLHLNLKEKDTKTVFQAQHLYIISDDEIKKDDWYYHKGFNKVFQAKGTSKYSKETNEYKIIATTDISLIIEKQVGEWIGTDYTLPQPSQQFIEKFIEAYNKGKVITDVLVEYDYCTNRKTKGDLSKCPKINLKDNTITIKKLKDSWNRKELEILFKKHEQDVIKYINGLGPSATLSFNDKWIKENL